MFTNPILSTASKPVIDWNRAEEHAKSLGEQELRARIQGLRAALQPSWELDFEDDGTRQGYYYDELSVCHRAMAQRQENKAAYYRAMERECRTKSDAIRVTF